MINTCFNKRAAAAILATAVATPALTGCTNEEIALTIGAIAFTEHYEDLNLGSTEIILGGLAVIIENGYNDHDHHEHHHPYRPDHNTRPVTLHADEIPSGSAIRLYGERTTITGVIPDDVTIILPDSAHLNIRNDQYGSNLNIISYGRDTFCTTRDLRGTNYEIECDNITINGNVSGDFHKISAERYLLVNGHIRTNYTDISADHLSITGDYTGDGNYLEFQSCASIGGNVSGHSTIEQTTYDSAPLSIGGRIYSDVHFGSGMIIYNGPRAPSCTIGAP